MQYYYEKTATGFVVKASRFGANAEIVALATDLKAAKKEVDKRNSA